jgi:hypothetical protein
MKASPEVKVLTVNLKGVVGSTEKQCNVRNNDKSATGEKGIFIARDRHLS